MANGAQFRPDYYSGKDNASPLYLIDGVNPLLIATVAQFHNSDNQALPSTAYGLLTGGVDQLLNSSGNLDRKRSAYGDALATTGIEASGLMLWNGASFDRQQGKQGVGDVSTGGRSTVAVAASTAVNTVVKGTPGRLARVLVTATGTASLMIYDNATTNSGTIIGILPASPTVGAVYDFGLPAANGITVGGSSTNPGVTISFY